MAIGDVVESHGVEWTVVSEGRSPVLMHGGGDRVAPCFCIVGEIDERVRADIRSVTRKAFRHFEERGIRADVARRAADEATRLMLDEAEPAEQTNTYAAVFSKDISDRAWMSVGIDPMLGDLIVGKPPATDQGDDHE